MSTTIKSPQHTQPKPQISKKSSAIANAKPNETILNKKKSHLRISRNNIKQDLQEENSSNKRSISTNDVCAVSVSSCFEWLKSDFVLFQLEIQISLAG